MIISAETTVVASPHVLACDLAEESVLLQMPEGIYFGLNTTGTRVWNLIQDPRKVGQVLDTLMSEYSVEQLQCETDLLTILQDMVDQGLASVRDAKGSSDSLR